MSLPFVVACMTALAPVLRGSWDLWAQSLIHLIAIIGFSIWLIAQIVIGYLPIPSRKTLYWTSALTVLGSVAVYFSPVPGIAKPEWWIFFSALWIFPAISALSKDQRAAIDQAVRAASWILMLLAFYQHISLGEQRPTSALVNQNVYAGAILMFLPLAIERDDYLLATGLILNLIWCRSVGAWAGLFGALALTQRRLSPFRFWIGAAGCLICAVALYARLGSPDVMHRWWWWNSAARMWLDRPMIGYGPGTYAVVLPAYLGKYPNGLFSSYVHNYPLQTTAEMGLPFCLIWFSGLWHCVERNRSLKRFGVIAVLIHSLWDYSLSMPSNLWLFAYCAASSIPDTSDGVNIPSNYKLPWLCVVAGLCIALSTAVWREWDGHRWLSRADAAASSGQLTQAAQFAESAARLIPDDGDVSLIQASLSIREGRWLKAAAYLEKSVQLNPYRSSAWTELSLCYRRFGRPDLADGAAIRSRFFLPVLGRS